MQNLALEEAKRQLAVCNACRYCEGFCAAFKAMTRYRAFDTETVVHVKPLPQLPGLLSQLSVHRAPRVRSKPTPCSCGCAG